MPPTSRPRTSPTSLVPPARRVPALVVAAVALGIEAAALIVVVAVYAVALLRSAAQDLLGAVVTAVLALAAAAGLALAARALLAGRRGARGPVLTWQLLQALIGATYLPARFPAPLRWGGLLALVLAVVTLACLFTPAAMRATRGSQSPSVR